VEMPDSRFLCHSKPFLERPWAYFDACCRLYCHQITNIRYDDAVQELLRPSLVMNFIEGVVGRGSDHTREYFKTLSSSMPTMQSDEAGFNHFCNTAQIAWVKVSYIELLAERRRAFPVRQHLDVYGFITGVPGQECRIFCVSHCWESSNHPSPTGAQMVELARILREQGARQHDVVFYDSLSLWQWLPKEGRTQEQNEAFDFALFAMARIYAYERCEVLVLNFMDQAFLDNPDPSFGKVNRVPYHTRGWCVFEFCVALMSGTLILDLPSAQEVLKSRSTWPKTVEAFESLLDEEMQSGQLHFTNGADKSVVSFAFFRACFSMLGKTEVDACTPAEADARTPASCCRCTLL